VEASKYNVFPLDNSILSAFLRRGRAVPPDEIFHLFWRTGRLDSASAPGIIAKSYTITAEVEVPQGGARE